VLDPNTNVLSYHITYTGLSSNETAAHIHGFAPPGMNAGVLFALPPGTPKIGSVGVTPAQATNIANGLTYANIHTQNFGGGEIRGQLLVQTITPPVNFCFGDGSGTACPCGNNSAVGAEAGCLNSFAQGGTLRATGVSSVGCDTISLGAASLPPTTSALFFQGTVQAGGGAGTLFGDGLRCAGGAVTRLGTKSTVGGAASYPATGDQPVSVRGGVAAGATHTYQTWYRNSASFCQPEGFNLTNGVQIVWVP
jgi:hypothetical protein